MNFRSARLRPLALSLMLGASGLPVADAALNTAGIIASAVSPSCIAWRMSGICYWLLCTPFGCTIKTSVKVTHFIPEAVVSAYQNPGKNPWTEMALLSGASGGVENVVSGALAGLSAGGGESVSKIPGARSLHTRFKYADAIGHPSTTLIGGQIPAVQAGQDADDPAIQDVIALMGFNAAQSAREEVSEQEEPSGFVDAGSGRAIDSGGVSLPVEEIQPVVAENDDGREHYGQQFISWLSEQVISGGISVNTKDAQVHIVGGLVFLPAPQIFFSFMKGNAYAPSLKNDVQRGFERLGLHFMQKGKGVFSCLKYEEEERKGRYERLAGYLIRSKIIYRTHPVPDDSMFLFVLRCN